MTFALCSNHLWAVKVEGFLAFCCFSERSRDSNHHQQFYELLTSHFVFIERQVITINSSATKKTIKIIQIVNARFD